MVVAQCLLVVVIFTEPVHFLLCFFFKKRSAFQINCMLQYCRQKNPKSFTENFSLQGLSKMLNDNLWKTYFKTNVPQIIKILKSVVNHVSHPINMSSLIQRYKVTGLYHIAHIIGLNPFNFSRLLLVPPLMLSS